ncbi:efflux RND transporter permease subunit [Cohnella cholangitidis]|uniref:Efflux RND transporter permease subunit n=1 Tax=Cohnella cholangitidis TaxID=2598458 RepID=A0A7G5C153_9BACL|nr:efflux RND transporter permease subunit [Cohnella cholangitidis]QMV42937.1 efflux RND transporter permease subunit [Cohnella cholangitidis]
MRSVIGFSLKNKFALWMITIIVIVAGLYSGMTMKQESLPNLNLPFLSVTTVSPGSAPDAVVKQITEPLEKRLTNVEGVKNITSTSMENVSSIFVEYDFGQNMDTAVAQLREAAAEVALPEGVVAPDISKFSFNSFPVISLSASGQGSLENLTKTVTDEIQPVLEGIPGVASVQIAGQYVQEVTLKFDQAKLAELGLSEDTVKGIIQGSALKVPLGLFQLDETQKTVVVDGRITTIDDLKKLAIPVVPSAAAPNMAAPNAAAPTAAAPETGAVNHAAPGTGGLPTVQLGDIAEIKLLGKAESISRTNGAESVGIQIVKANDANTVDVVNDVKAEADKLKEKFGDLKLDVLLDQGKPIEESVETMFSKALFGALFAVVVILLFLRNIRTTLISIVSIPLSLIIAVLFLKQFDVTLNIMTLGAMTVAIGRVVDDSIVVIENIYRRMSLAGEKLKGSELVLEATREMFLPIMSSTIVTIAVFLPLGLVSGMVGQIFLPFALTIVFALLASLIVAITVVPMLAHQMFKKGIKAGQSHDHEERPGRMANGYRRLLTSALNHKIITLVIAFALLVGSLFLVPLIGASFLPEQEDKYTMVTYSPDPGDSIEDVEERALIAEKYILEQSDITNLQYSVGGSNPLQPGPSKSGLFFVQYEHDTKDFADKKEALIEGLSKAVPIGQWTEMDMSGGLGGSSFSISVFGETLEDIAPVADEIAELMKADDSFEKVDTSLSKTYDQYTIVADQAKLSQYGLTAGQIAMALSPQRVRPVITQVEEQGKTYNVYVDVDKAEFKSVNDILDSKLQSPLGVAVPIRDVAQVEEGTSPNSIARQEGKMVVNVTGEITKSDVAKVSSDLQAKVDKLEKPATVEVKFGGVTEQINETFTQLGLAMAAAIAIVYLVLVLAFGGGLAPFAIMFSLPFAIIGGLVALYLTGETLSVSALMGALMLIGIVVTNAIVLIDRVIHKEKEGLSTREALIEAGGVRLRPILMTALATIGALLPLAFGFESAGIISKGLGVTVIGGLISSTLLTLLIVPIIYEILMKIKRKSRNSAA